MQKQGQARQYQILILWHGPLQLQEDHRWTQSIWYVLSTALTYYVIWFYLCLITESNFCNVFCAETNFHAVTHWLGPPQGTGEKLEQRQGFPQVVAHKAPVEERWVIVQLLGWVLTVGMLKTKKFGVNWINIWYLWPLAMPFVSFAPLSLFFHVFVQLRHMVNAAHCGIVQV